MAETTETVYRVVNDEAVMRAKGFVGVVLEMLLEPLWSSELPGPALRFATWTNQQRLEQGKLLTHGSVLLQRQTVARTPWETISEEEQVVMDDGRRAYGR